MTTTRLLSLTALAAGLAFALACFNGPAEPTVWEYKVVTAHSEGKDRTGVDALAYASVTPSEVELNQLGLDGWELATSYLEVETAYPNFGNEGYVTGLQPNVRPQRVVLVFKRPLVAKGGE